MANTEFITPMPAGFTFSAATKKAIAARDKAFRALQDFKLEHADYAPVPVANGTIVPAIRKAQGELAALDRAAVKAGKPLPNREEYLKPHKEKAEQYLRTVKVLSAEYDQASRDAEDVITDEMPTLARKSLEECAKVHQEWTAAVEAMEAAESRMNAAVNRLVWAASDSRMNQSAGTGWADYSDTRAFELTEDGRLTRRAAQAIGLETYQGGSVVVHDDLVDWDSGAAPLHPRSQEVSMAIGNSPMDAVQAESVYDIARLSPEDYSRHFD
ncbi:hypothetical protein [Streptomyces tendae]|uniref:hypothetical protein n=1 Tax=Streptomyces tendae TaxID=1932 RepID=UPI00367CA78A